MRSGNFRHCNRSPTTTPQILEYSTRLRRGRTIALCTWVAVTFLGRKPKRSFAPRLFFAAEFETGGARVYGLRYGLSDAMVSVVNGSEGRRRKEEREEEKSDRGQETNLANFRIGKWEARASRGHEVRRAYSRGRVLPGYSLPRRPRRPWTTFRQTGDALYVLICMKLLQESDQPQRNDAFDPYGT